MALYFAMSGTGLEYLESEEKLLTSMNKSIEDLDSEMCGIQYDIYEQQAIQQEIREKIK